MTAGHGAGRKTVPGGNMTGMEELLGGHPFFAGLDASALRLIAGCASNVHFAAGDRIFDEAEEASRFYVSRHGRVAMEDLGRAHGWPPVTTLDLVCRLLLEKK